MLGSAIQTLEVLRVTMAPFAFLGGTFSQI
jgi:hypothetical protein